METVSISEAARILGRHRPAIYRLLESGVLRRLPGCRIPAADLDKLPKQKRRLREVALARIRLAGHDPRRILIRLLKSAVGGADADTLIHAGRFLLEGNPDFLRTIEAPVAPVVKWKAPDGVGVKTRFLNFPEFIAGRIRLYRPKLKIPDLSVLELWQAFWRTVIEADFYTFPLFRGGWMQLAPEWQNDATIYCQEQETVLSFSSPLYRPAPDERKAARYMAEHFPDSKVRDLYGLDNITPALLLIIRAMIAARHGDKDSTRDYLKQLPDPSAKQEQDELIAKSLAAARKGETAKAARLLAASEQIPLGLPDKIIDALFILVRRTLGEYRLKQSKRNIDTLRGSDASGNRRPVKVGGVWKQPDAIRAESLHLPQNRAAVAQALGISRPTLYAWTKAPRRSRQAAD